MAKLETKVFDARISDLTETEHNPRQITKDDFTKLKQSLKDFPEMLSIREVVIDENNVILGGHQRVRAAKANGNKTITVKQVIGLSDAKKREFIIKDNVANGDWDLDEIANAWGDIPFQDWGADIAWADESEPTDLDADGKDDDIFIKISFKSADEANRFLDDMRAKINEYECNMTTHGGAL